MLTQCFGNRRVSIEWTKTRWNEACDGTFTWLLEVSTLCKGSQASYLVPVNDVL